MLEASPLPRAPLLTLGRVQYPRSSTPIELDYQSREEEDINGTPELIKPDTNYRRFPFVVLLDGIVSTLEQFYSSD